jgi:phosphoglycolate phosphatase
LPIRLIIFDLDGTLVDSILDTTNAINYALKPYSLCDFKPAEVAKMLSLTNNAIGVIHKILEQYNIREDTNVPVERYLKYYSSHLTDTTVTYPGTIETLEALHSYSKAIVTNKPERFAVKILSSLGLYKYFDIIVGGDTVPERKPSSAPIIHILINLNVKPENAILVGDGKADIDSGKASGLRTVAATHGYGEAGFEKEADLVIESMPNLLEIVPNFL